MVKKTLRFLFLIIVFGNLVNADVIMPGMDSMNHGLRVMPPDEKTYTWFNVSTIPLFLIPIILLTKLIFIFISKKNERFKIFNEVLNVLLIVAIILLITSFISMHV